MATRRGPDNSVRVGIGMTEGAVNMACVLWAQLTVSGTPPITDLDAWTTSFANAFKTNFSPHIGNSVNFTQAQAQLFLPSSGILTSLVPLTGTGGGATVGGQNQSTSAVISWQINAYWRGGKPRTYLPFVPTADIATNDSLSAAAITSLLSEANAFRTAVNALVQGAITATALGTVSFRSGNADRVPPVFFPYTGAKVHPRLGTQRRRLGKWRP